MKSAINLIFVSSTKSKYFGFTIRPDIMRVLSAIFLISIFLLGIPATIAKMTESERIKNQKNKNLNTDNLDNPLAEQDDDLLELLSQLSTGPKTTCLIINPAQVRKGENVFLSATLRNDSNQEGIKDAPISFYVAEDQQQTDWVLLGTAITEADGTAVLETTIHLAPGSYALKAEFFGDARFFNSKVETSPQSGLVVMSGIPKPLSVFLPNFEFVYGLIKPIRLYVTTESSDWSLGDTLNVEIVSENEFIVIPGVFVDSGGIGTLDLPCNMSSGDYSIRIRQEKETQSESSNQIIGMGKLRITSVPTIVSMFPATGYYSDEVTLQAELSEITGTSIVDGALLFSLVSDSGTLEYLGTANTDEAGCATSQYTIWMKPGIYTIQVNYNGSTDTQPCQNNNTLIVLQEKTQIYIPLAESVSASELDIVAYLYDNDYSSIADVSLQFYYRDHNLGAADPWHFLGSNETSLDGRTSFRVLISTLPAVVDVLIEFSGNVYYTNAMSYDKLEIAVTHISFIGINVQPVQYGKIALISGQLVDEYGDGINGSTVHLRIWNNSLEITAKTTTDEDGNFTIVSNPIFFRPRLYPFELRYELVALGNVTSLHILKVQPRTVYLDSEVNIGTNNDGDLSNGVSVGDQLELVGLITYLDSNSAIDGTPVVGAQLGIQIFNMTNDLVLDTVISSDSDGKVQYFWTPDSAGQYSFIVNLLDVRYSTNLLLIPINIEVSAKTTQINIEMLNQDAKGVYRRGDNVSMLVSAVQLSETGPTIPFIGLVELWIDVNLIKTFIFDGSITTQFFSFNISQGFHLASESHIHVRPGLHKLYANSISGNLVNGSVRTNPVILIVKDQTSLDVRTAFNVQTQNLQVRATLYDQERLPVENQQVFLILDHFQVLTTNEIGTVSYDLNKSLVKTILAKGLEVYAFYPGSEYYDSTHGTSKELSFIIKSFLRASPAITRAFITNALIENMGVTDPDKIDTVVELVHELASNEEPDMDVNRFNEFFDAANLSPYFSAHGSDNDLRIAITANPANITEPEMRLMRSIKTSSSSSSTHQTISGGAMLVGLKPVTIADPLVTWVTSEYLRLQNELQAVYGGLFELSFPDYTTNITACALDAGFDLEQTHFDSPIDIDGYIYVNLTPKAALYESPQWDMWQDTDFPITIAVPSPIGSGGLLTGFPCPLPFDGVWPDGSICDLCGGDKHVTLSEFNQWIQWAFGTLNHLNMNMKINCKISSNQQTLENLGFVDNGDPYTMDSLAPEFADNPDFMKKLEGKLQGMFEPEFLAHFKEVFANAPEYIETAFTRLAEVLNPDWDRFLSGEGGMLGVMGAMMVESLDETMKNIEESLDNAVDSLLEAIDILTVAGAGILGSTTIKAFEDSKAAIETLSLGLVATNGVLGSIIVGNVVGVDASTALNLITSGAADFGSAFKEFANELGSVSSSLGSMGATVLEAVSDAFDTGSKALSEVAKTLEPIRSGVVSGIAALGSVLASSTAAVGKVVSEAAEDVSDLLDKTGRAVEAAASGRFDEAFYLVGEVIIDTTEAVLIIDDVVEVVTGTEIDLNKEVANLASNTGDWLIDTAEGTIDTLSFVMETIAAEIVDLYESIFGHGYTILKTALNMQTPFFAESIAVMFKDIMIDLAEKFKAHALDDTTFDDLPDSPIPTFPQLPENIPLSLVELLLMIIPTDQITDAIINQILDQLDLPNFDIKESLGLSEAVDEAFGVLSQYIDFPTDKIIGLLFEVISLLAAQQYGQLSVLVLSVLSATYNFASEILVLIGNTIGDLLTSIIYKLMQNPIVDFLLQMIGSAIDYFLMPIYIIQSISGLAGSSNKIDQSMILLLKIEKTDQENMNSLSINNFYTISDLTTYLSNWIFKLICDITFNLCCKFIPRIVPLSKFHYYMSIGFICETLNLMYSFILIIIGINEDIDNKDPSTLAEWIGARFRDVDLNYEDVVFDQLIKWFFLSLLNWVGILGNIIIRFYKMELFCDQEKIKESDKDKGEWWPLPPGYLEDHYLESYQHFSWKSNLLCHVDYFFVTDDRTNTEAFVKYNFRWFENRISFIGLVIYTFFWVMLVANNFYTIIDEALTIIPELVLSLATLQIIKAIELYKKLRESMLFQLAMDLIDMLNRGLSLLPNSYDSFSEVKQYPGRMFSRKFFNIYTKGDWKIRPVFDQWKRGKPAPYDQNDEPVPQEKMKKGIFIFKIANMWVDTIIMVADAFLDFLDLMVVFWNIAMSGLKELLDSE